MDDKVNQWGVELNGADQDKEAWRAFLKRPFDPFVEEVKDERGDYLALRSTVFRECMGPDEVRQLAKHLFRTLNVAMATNADADPITTGPVIDFSSDGQPRKHFYMEVEAGMIRIRGSIVTLTVADAQGNVIEAPPAPSKAQMWMRAAALKPSIGNALDYLEGKPGWFELYKAYEALRDLANGGISNNEIERFTRTANAGNRHHPDDKIKPHKRPMELWEARALITQWVSAAIEDVLAKNGYCASDTKARDD